MKINWTAIAILSLAATQLPMAIKTVIPWWQSFHEHQQKLFIEQRVAEECSETARKKRGPVLLKRDDLDELIDPHGKPIQVEYEWEVDCISRVRNQK
jgi:hypothetical protein